MENNANRDWLTKEEAETFIGTNVYSYLEKWKTHSGSKLKGFNWAAAAFGIVWMAYRRMYAEAVLTVILFSFMGSAISLLFGVFDIYFNEPLIGYFFRLLVGIFGNMLYRNKAMRVLRKTIYMDEAERLACLKAKGGTSVVGVIICIAIQIAEVVLFWL